MAVSRRGARLAEATAGALGPALRDCCPDREHAVADELAERVDAADVDQNGRMREPQCEDRDQALSAREDLCLVAVLAQQRQGFVDRPWRYILEGWGFHGRQPKASGLTV